jgi:hypothetical protein
MRSPSGPIPGGCRSNCATSDSFISSTAFSSGRPRPGRRGGLAYEFGDEQPLAVPRAIRVRATQKRRDGPGEGQRRSHEPDLLIVEMQVIGNEGHQEIGGVAVQEYKAKGDGQHPNQLGFVFHPPHST